MPALILLHGASATLGLAVSNNMEDSPTTTRSHAAQAVSTLKTSEVCATPTMTATPTPETPRESAVSPTSNQSMGTESETTSTRSRDRRSAVLRTEHFSRCNWYLHSFNTNLLLYSFHGKNAKNHCWNYTLRQRTRRFFSSSIITVFFNLLPLEILR